MAVQIQFRRDTGANWASANTVLAEGELGINTTTNQFKIGNGSTAWNSLSYAPLSGTVADLDDITNVVITSASSGQFLKWNGSAWVNDAIDLSTDTTGSYVTSLVAGTGVTLANNSGEGATPTVTVDTSVIAPLASPTFTGTPTLPTGTIAVTQNAADSSTKVATTAFVTGAVTDLIGGAPGALNTLNELAEAIGDDASYAAGITTALGLKAPLASPTFTGTVTVPTPVSNTDASTKVYVDSTASTTASAAATALTNHEADTTNIHGIADTSILVTTSGTQTLTNKTITTPAGLVKGDVGLGNVDNTADTAKPVSTAQQTALDLKANLASPTFTGTPTLPTGTIAVTQTAANNSTAVATTAYVDNAASSAASALSVDGLFDTTITTATAGQFLKYSGSAWVNDAIDLGTDTTGNYMTDVSAGTGITVTHTPSEGSTATIALNAGIDALTDVTITSAASNQLLQYNGSAWVNATVSTTPTWEDSNNVLANAVFG